MAGVLHIGDPVVTGEDLRRQHQGQKEVRFGPQAVVTPTAWDYIREHQLQVSRDENSGRLQASAPSATGNRPAEPLIQEVVPEQRLVQEGRCDHPDRACGCKTEEFGSGFVEPSSCHDCTVHQLQKESQDNSGCEGCNRHETAVSSGQTDDLETLVRQITDLVMEELRKR